MAITYDLTSADTDVLLLSKTRFWIGDTIENSGAKPNGDNFSDDEIRLFLSEEDSDSHKAAALGLETLANIWSAHAGHLRLGPESEISRQANAYAERAVNLRNQYGHTTNAKRSGSFFIQPKPAGKS